jgi:hypothetical protein
VLLSAAYVELNGPLPEPVPGVIELPNVPLRAQLVAFEIVKLSVDGLPSGIVDGVAVKVEMPGFGFTVTVALPVFGQPADGVTVTEIETVLPLAAVHVIAGVPWPAVIVPPVSVHT